jgi:class 3 adenylate cyclase
MPMPSTQYTRRDGLHIGYQVWGDGERDILDLGFGTYISIDEAAEQIRWRRYSERLASCGRLIRFDPVGIGLSDAPDRLDQLTYDNWVRDAVCVLDAVGSTRAVVLAASSSTLAALAFASHHPDRTESLVLINGTARYVEDDDYAIGVPASLMREFQAGLDPDRPDEVSEDLNDLRLFAPSGVGDPEFEQWWSRASRRGAAPATAAVLSELTAGADFRDLLPGISRPTLVVHRHGARAPSVAHGQYVAERIPRARLVTLPGNDVTPFTGDLDEILDEIQEFVTGDRYQAEPERVLATMLFTDIVESTATAASLGDRNWTRVLADYNSLVDNRLQRFDGHLVKDTGDGSLATFDSPSRAIRCALAVREGALHLGIQVRAGLHAGEIERRGDDVGGIAVHVAARVAGAAGSGEVLVTGTIVDLVEGSGIEFTDRGSPPLKGVPGLRRLWAVVTA